VCWRLILSAALLTRPQLGDQPVGTLSICNRDRCNRVAVSYR